MDQAKSTIAQSEPLERVAFQVSASFKMAIDMELARRRTTLRAEGTEAFARHFGLTVPTEAVPEAASSSPAASAA